ncbi:hypothetical protein D9M71_345830 [compost metagenome]
MSTFCPVFKPVSPIDLVLVEQVRQTLSQLIAFAQIGVMGQEALQRLEVWLVDQLRQQAHQSPGQRSFIEQGLGRNFIAPKDHAIELPHETAGQLHVDSGGDSAATHVVFFGIFCQCQLQPLGNAVALHQRDFILQGSQRVAPHPADHQAAQLVQAIAVNHHESSTEGRGVRHKASLENANSRDDFSICRSELAREGRQR